MPLKPSAAVCANSVMVLNHVLADSITIRDLYKQQDWHVSGRAAQASHALFNRHSEEQAALVKDLAERIQVLGGVSIAMLSDVDEDSRDEHVGGGREVLSQQIGRLLEAHAILLRQTVEAAEAAVTAGDAGTAQLLTSRVVAINEAQVQRLTDHPAL